MNIVYSPIVAEFQPFTANAYFINIHKQPIKDIETLRKEREFAILSQFYTFSDRHNKDEVIRFIKDHLFLFNTLLEAPKHIFSIFGKDIVLELELHNDPEEDFIGLFITIKTKTSPDDSLNLLNKLDEKWWLYVDDNISNILEIMVRPT